MEVQRASEYALGSGECQFLVEQARSSSSAAAGEGASSFKTQFTDMITLQLPVPLFRGLLETQGFSQGLLQKQWPRFSIESALRVQMFVYLCVQ